MGEKNPGNQQRHQGFADAENHFRQACEIFEREATTVRQEQESIDAMSNKFDQVHFSSTIKLNVGGQHFVTGVQTLRKDPKSMLAAMFSEKFDTKPSEPGRLVLYRPRRNSLPLYTQLSSHREVNLTGGQYISQGARGGS